MEKIGAVAAACLILIWLGLAAYFDRKCRKIPNRLILSGVLLWGIFGIIKLAAGECGAKDLLSAAAAGLLPGLLLFPLAAFTKHKLGMGDVKLILVLGLLLGLRELASVLLFSLAVFTFVCLILLLRKKIGLKSGLPLAPFIFAGYLLRLAAGLLGIRIL